MKITHYIQVYLGQFDPRRKEGVKQLFCEACGLEAESQMLRRGEYWDQMYKFDAPIDGECSWCLQRELINKFRGTR